MNQEATLIRAGLKTPRAAAVAGILFSVFLIAGLLFIPAFGPGRPARGGGLAEDQCQHNCSGAQPDTVRWHRLFMVIAVLRDRLGELEDRFFCHCLLGSGLLFLAMLGDSTLSSTSPAPGLCSKSAGMSAIRHFRRRNTFEAFQSAGQQVVAPGRDKRLTAEYAGTF